jgi:hypothetical protein
MKRYHVFRLVEDKLAKPKAKPAPVLSSDQAMAKAIRELKRDMEQTIMGGHPNLQIKWAADDLGRRDRNELQVFGCGRHHSPMVFFDRGGEVAVQILPQVSHPSLEYEAAEESDGVAFGFDYIDLKGNYRAADGAIIFNGPTNGELKMRDDGTMALSG